MYGIFIVIKKNKVKPFYFYTNGVPKKLISLIVKKIPFSPSKSSYWDNKNKEPIVIGCANTYIFQSDCDQGSCFEKLNPHQVLRWIKEGVKHPCDSELDSLDKLAFQDAANSFVPNSDPRIEKIKKELELS